MKANVKYFGMIAEKTKCSSEEITLDKADALINLNVHFENKYPFLSHMNYKIAVNQTFVNTLAYNENASIEIAILPPFAGG